MWTLSLRRFGAQVSWEVAVCGALVGGCGRVTGDVQPIGDSSAEAEPRDASVPVRKKGTLGGTCEPLSELDPEFSGFNVDDVSIDEHTPACVSETCVIQGFQGRVSCPYGQAEAASGCTIPGADEPVLVGVSPQLVARPPSVGAVCSCHCAGPGPGPYCACPSHLQCAKLVDDLGFGASDLAGSYCLPKGARYERGAVDISSECLRDLQNCGP